MSSVFLAGGLVLSVTLDSLGMVIWVGSLSFLSGWWGEFVGLSSMGVWLMLLAGFILTICLMLQGDSQLAIYGSLFPLLYFFSSWGGWGFYVSFELCLLPMVWIVLSGGYNMERFKAYYYLVAYTLVGSIPLLVSLVGGGSSGWLGVCWILAFLVKLAVFGVHSWLPLAHVEAPTIGSIMLAALLLKLGTYGLMSVNFYSLEQWSAGGSLILLAGAVASGIVCLGRSDSKVYVAYSSINHMSLSGVVVLGGVWGGNVGAILLGVGHGVVSAAMFLFVGQVSKKLGSRSLFLKFSGLNSSGLLGFAIALIFFFNCATPPSLNFVSEAIIVWGMVLNYGLVGALVSGLNVLMVGLLMVLLWVNYSQGPAQGGGQWLSEWELVCLVTLGLLAGVSPLLLGSMGLS